MIFGNPGITYAATVEVEAESAILVDAETGKILFEKEADLTLPPASMTKMMTEYLVLEAIEEGEISWDTTTQISDYPYSISADPSFSGVGLTQNQDYTVRELYEAMAINSDNATTIALAELIAGSEGAFVKMMNKKAAELGLPDYQFVNSTGLSNSNLGENYPEGTEPNANNLLSARSAALLAYHLVNDYPEALEITSITTTEFDGQQIRNWNWMLPNMPGYLADYGYEGMDGLKTGWTDLAGYCFTGTAERDGQRFISVVMKTNSEEARFQETRKLLDYGFKQFEQKELFPAGYQIEGESEVPVAKGKEGTVEIEAAEDLTTPVKNGQEDMYEVKYNISKEHLDKDGNLTAPIKKGEKIGTVELVYNGEDNYKNLVTGKTQKTAVDLVTTSAVEKSNWFMLMVGGVGNFFSDIFTSAMDMVKGWF
ncbi:D-alanyl-D-alanine carboxypeptidase [Halobacillus shinanisalinarum]|uniref:serine-type D-Ala-D-Ala carboxypeptidase n=2 Tax=Halobacillus shinanisalinarum TaxID=2932258 RepID=A0ABY4H5D2_9BACI|nr:serine hydrolase [Halobacillus shinanisalinarum]UOQ95681.1 D-alanyl-D-alanine carboxypeptidase [Halobacillus shinanisalinarum]